MVSLVNQANAMLTRTDFSQGARRDKETTTIEEDLFSGDDAKGEGRKFLSASAFPEFRL